MNDLVFVIISLTTIVKHKNIENIKHDKSKLILFLQLLNE